ncbi:porin family protein [Enterovibrio norvegicus]|uniref:porin family protein n=1 Tax=Enterovibrio norvegicus TaxID=188144 RepID=UPI003D0CD0C6
MRQPKRFIHIAVLIPLLGVCAAFSAQANEITDYHLGLKAGYQVTTDDIYQGSDPTGAMVGILAGVSLGPTWAIEVDYQTHSELHAEATGVRVSTQLISAAVRYEHDWSSAWATYGRLGAAYWDVEKAREGSQTLDAKGLSMLTEVGIRYTLQPGLQLRGGYQFIQGMGNAVTGEYNSHGAMLSLNYAFGDILNGEK